MRHSAIGQIFSCPIFTVPGVFVNVNLAQFFSHFLAANAITEILYYIKPPPPPSVYHVHNIPANSYALGVSLTPAG